MKCLDISLDNIVKKASEFLDKGKLFLIGAAAYAVFTFGGIKAEAREAPAAARPAAAAKAEPEDWKRYWDLAVFSHLKETKGEELTNKTYANLEGQDTEFAMDWILKYMKKNNLQLPAQPKTATWDNVEEIWQKRVQPYFIDKYGRDETDKFYNNSIKGKDPERAMGILERLITRDKIPQPAAQPLLSGAVMPEIRAEPKPVPITQPKPQQKAKAQQPGTTSKPPAVSRRSATQQKRIPRLSLSELLIQRFKDQNREKIFDSVYSDILLNSDPDLEKAQENADKFSKEYNTLGKKYPQEAADMLRDYIRKNMNFSEFLAEINVGINPDVFGWQNDNYSLILSFIEHDFASSIGNEGLRFAVERESYNPKSINANETITSDSADGIIDLSRRVLDILGRVVVNYKLDALNTASVETTTKSGFTTTTRSDDESRQESAGALISIGEETDRISNILNSFFDVIKTTNQTDVEVRQEYGGEPFGDPIFSSSETEADGLRLGLENISEFGNIETIFSYVYEELKQEGADAETFNQFLANLNFSGRRGYAGMFALDDGEETDIGYLAGLTILQKQGAGVNLNIGSDGKDTDASLTFYIGSQSNLKTSKINEYLRDRFLRENIVQSLSDLSKKTEQRIDDLSLQRYLGEGFYLSLGQTRTENGNERYLETLLQLNTISLGYRFKLGDEGMDARTMQRFEARYKELFNIYFEMTDYRNRNDDQKLGIGFMMVK